MGHYGQASNPNAMISTTEIYVITILAVILALSLFAAQVYPKSAARIQSVTIVITAMLFAYFGWLAIQGCQAFSAHQSLELND